MELYTKLSEAELITLLKSDNQLAFEELHSRFKSGIYHYALRICKDDNVADEIVQSVMLKVWQHRREIDAEQNFKGWISKVTANQAFDHLKAVSKERTLKEKIWQQMQMLPIFTEDQYVLKEYLVLIEEAVRALPLQQQRVYRLSREEDLTYEQIAKQLGISANTVRNHMASALSNIRNYVNHNTSAVLPQIMAACLLYGHI